MIDFLFAAAIGAVAIKFYPPADALASRVRDWLYSLFKRAPDDTDAAGA